MKVTLLQRDIVWANPAENRHRAESIINNYNDTELFVLPEMWTTGFATKPDGIAESASSDSLLWMKQIAQKKNCAICGSIAVNDEGRFYNRFYFVMPDGNEIHYNKRHLFTYGVEHLTYTPGTSRVVVNYKDIRFLLQVCYDLRFPVWSRNRGDYDVAIYVASWPTPRIKAWNALLKARAIENQCYVIGVNRVGSDPQFSYSGGSIIRDAYGKAIARCENDKECEISASIDMETLNKFRAKFPVLNDADDFPPF